MPFCFPCNGRSSIRWRPGMRNEHYVGEWAILGLSPTYQCRPHSLALNIYQWYTSTMIIIDYIYPKPTVPSPWSFQVKINKTSSSTYVNMCKTLGGHRKLCFRFRGKIEPKSHHQKQSKQSSHGVVSFYYKTRSFLYKTKRLVQSLF